MSPLPSDTASDVMTIPLSPAERAAIDELKLMTRLTDDADLLRLAIWHLAKHCGRDVDGLFELQLGRRPRKAKT